MARKQKKLTRKQRIQQQQAAIGHRREDKGWISPNEKAQQRAELTEDMAPLVWDEGMAAIYEGELYLELFTPDEIEAGDNILKTALGIDTLAETDAVAEARPELTEEKGRTFVAELNTYLTERLTLERMDELRTRLQRVLHEGSYPPPYTPFIYMVTEHMADAEAATYERSFLMHALVGEMRVAAKSAVEEAVSTPTEAE